MIQSPNYSQRSGRTIRLVILHTAEGARTVESLGSFFANSAVQASSHVGIDDTKIAQYVPYSMAAWTAGGANSISDQAELCGFARWTRAEWLGQHRRMLELAAQWVRERCLARGIPIRKLSPAQVAAGEPGVCGHADWSQGMRDTDHWDPGPNFPWDFVIGLAAGVPAAPVAAPAAPPPVPLEDDVMYIKCQLNPGQIPPQIGYAILSGSLFIGLGSEGEKASADAMIRDRRAPEQWVELETWKAMDAQSHAVHDTPKRVVVAPSP